MATPSGQISFEDIRTEFGTAQANNSLNNYYSGGSALGAPLINVPASGAISISQLKVIEKTSGSGNQVNVASGVPNGTHVIFFTNGVCHSNNTATEALIVPSGRSGGTTVIINHNIAGRCGNGSGGQNVTFSDNSNAAGTGTAGDGGNGGTAVFLGSTTHIQNNAIVRAGSGGGGGGSAFGAPVTGFISNGITCTSTDLKGIVTNTNGSTRFTIGSAGGGGGAGNSTISNSADGTNGSAGSGGHTTNFANGNRIVTENGTQCTSDSSKFSSRSVKMVSNSNAGGTPSGGGSGFGGNTNGASGGSDGNAGGSTSAANGTTNFPSISDNGVTVNQLSGVGGDGASAGSAGNAFSNWNSNSTAVHGIASTQGTFTGGVS
jgi:hypothetical protein